MTDAATRTSATRWLGAGIATWAMFAVWLLVADPDARSTITIVDVIETLVPLVAGLVCLSAARRSVNGPTSWLLGGAGVVAWGLGQAVWTWYEVVLGVEVPFPSLADIGYLAFPVLASVGVALYHANNRSQRSSIGAALEGALLAASLFAISWFTLLQGLIESGSPSAYGFWLSLAYPIGDVILLAMVLHAVSQLRSAPASLWLLCTGLVVMAVADSAFVWMVEQGSFSTGGWVDLAWITAFAIIGVGGWRAHLETDREEATLDAPRIGLLLPYVPFALGMGVIAARGWTGQLGRIELVVAGVLIALVLARQFIALVDNQSLLSTLRAREAELHHLAMHDPLTGLANRALLANRLQHAIAQREHPDTSLGLLLVDLDDFKEVNDFHGHAAGDDLLVTVADRLRECVRAHDTVARLGGDEFAILLDPTSDNAETVAQRVLGALTAPVLMDPPGLQISASVGIGEVRTGGDGEREGQATRAMREADIAMYAAKAAGKNRWRRYGPELAVLGMPKAQDAAQTLPGQGARYVAETEANA